MLDRSSIEALDSQQMLSSIEVFNKQCTDAWDATKAIEFPDAYRNVNSIVLFGMGGSALGIDVVKSLFATELRLPVEIVNGYDIPACVNKDTLAILSSYSGTTEEVVTASRSILKHTKNVFVTSTGGDLEAFAKEHKLPAYIFDPKFNPSNQPRMAVGYSVMAILGVFTSLGFLNVTDDQVREMAAFLEELNKSIGADVPDDNNQAKQLASKMNGHVPVLVSSEHLEGTVHVSTNQINENGKCFAARFPIPEMNHHLIEGLVHPREALDRLFFLFINSEHYHQRNRTRYTVTEEVVSNNNIEYAELKLAGPTPFIQAFELLMYGSYISFYLAILAETDPSPIPNVDFLKAELKKS